MSSDQLESSGEAMDIESTAEEQQADQDPEPDQQRWTSIEKAVIQGEAIQHLGFGKKS